MTQGEISAAFVEVISALFINDPKVRLCNVVYLQIDQTAWLCLRANKILVILYRVLKSTSLIWDSKAVYSAIKPHLLDTLDNLLNVTKTDGHRNSITNADLGIGRWLSVIELFSDF